MALASADAEAVAAARIVQDVTDSIERYKNRVLSEQEAASIRDELKRKLQDAQTHCDKAIGVDGRNLYAWIQRVRALRLAADTDGARSAVEQAQALFPDNAELRRLQQLINSSQ
jgi:hypothetical protein